MKPKKLKFIEQYIDEEPTNEHSWRGISCYVGKDSVFSISYLPKKREYSEPTHFEMDTTLGSPGSEFRRKIYGKFLRTKEEAKEFAQEMFNIYVDSLCDPTLQLAFANWLSINYNIENGIGYWSDYTEDDTQYTTEDLWKYFNQELKNEKET